MKLNVDLSFSESHSVNSLTGLCLDLQAVGIENPIFRVIIL